MDWAEERYVRLYVRDTGDMLAIGWQGRAVFAELMRKVDRAGILDETDPDILAELFRMPLEVCAEGLTRLCLRGVIEVTPDAIVIPNFIEAQEAKQSDKQRQAESRAKRRDRARGRSVTTGDGESQNVTDSHMDSEPVTDGHSVPSRAVPSRAVPPSPPSGLADQVVAGYTEISGSEELRIDGCRTPRQDTAILRMLEWSQRDLPKLFAELKRLKRDKWIASQPIHIWAERLGTGKAAVTGKKKTGAYIASADTNYEPGGVPRI